MVEAKDVVVVGGGFAGLSAGVTLAERGFRVAVLERKPELGGRAYSFVQEEGGDQVDNGQHVLMGCYHETLDFLDRIGARDNLFFHRDLEIRMLEQDGVQAVLKTSRMPGPLHMSGALLRYRHLRKRDRIRLMMGGVKLLSMLRRERTVLEGLSVAELMDRLGQGERARQCFWYPLSIATLNDEPEVSSAALLAEVLKRAFFSRRSDSAFVYSRVGLSELYCKAAANFIEKRGGVVATHCNVDALDFADGAVTRVRLRDGRKLGASNFVLAVPPHQLLRLLPDNVKSDPFFARAGKLESSPIVCVHTWFDREVTDAAFAGFIGTTTQWMFNKRRIFARHGERHPGYLSFVISGARRLVDRSNDDLLDIVLGDLRTMIPAAREAEIVKALVIKEKHATMAPAPETFRLRPTASTPVSNLFVAGDWIQTGLPATIESAVVSGRAAARALEARYAEKTLAEAA